MACQVYWMPIGRGKGGRARALGPDPRSAWAGPDETRKGIMRMRRALTVFVAVVCLLVGVMAATSAARGNNGGRQFEVLVIPNADTEVYYDWG